MYFVFYLTCSLKVKKDREPETVAVIKSTPTTDWLVLFRLLSVPLTLEMLRDFPFPWYFSFASFLFFCFSFPFFYGVFVSY
jgi:hypothetical protein